MEKNSTVLICLLLLYRMCFVGYIKGYMIFFFMLILYLSLSLSFHNGSNSVHSLVPVMREVMLKSSYVHPTKGHNACAAVMNEMISAVTHHT